MQEIAADMGDAGMEHLDFGLGFLPVVAELRLARHDPLIACQSLFVLPETVERFDESTIAQRGEAGNRSIPALSCL